MYFPINWMSPLSFIHVIGASGVIFIFISCFDEIFVSKENSPKLEAAFCGVTSGAILFALLSHKNDARLICVNFRYADWHCC